jgi:hypothetical protein
MPINNKLPLGGEEAREKLLGAGKCYQRTGRTPVRVYITFPSESDARCAPLS